LCDRCRRLSLGRRSCRLRSNTSAPPHGRCDTRSKIFVDAFWNSRQESFTKHLLRLMKSWALVCDVWFLEPQTQRAGESAVEFSNRVKDMIAKKAGLRSVEWDGYLKFWSLNFF
jgi:hypothetical protein